MDTMASSGLDLFRVLGSTAMVLLLLVGMLWLLRRLQAAQRTQGGPSQLKLLETISLGPRQKIALLRIGSHQVLVGITASQFTALGAWPEATTPQENDDAA